MGVNNFATKSAGQVISQDDPNQYKTGLTVDVVPRNSSGVPTSEAGDLGTSTYPWKNAVINVGYWKAGDIKMFHDFNGTVSPGQGWMKCNGDVVNSTNYDAIHGAGSWTSYIGTSPLDGLNLPDMDDKFPVGTDDTTQDGSLAITTEGNSSHQVNLAHTHTGPSHNHQWWESAGGSSTPNMTGNTSTIRSFNSGGSLQSINTGSDQYTSNNGTGNTGSSLSAAQNIKPESVALEFWIRII